MAIQNYELSVEEVLKSEGGYSNDPNDPGGPTNFGITIHDYRAYINHTGTAEDVKHMTVDQAKAIYKAKYWNAVDGDHLPSGVDYCVFDYGVNSGISRALRVANNLTARQYAASQDVIWLINQICDERLRFLKSLHTWNYFGRGWTTRVAHVRALSLQIARKEDPWLTTQTKNLLQQPMQSSTTSSAPSRFRAWLTSLLKIFSMAWFKGNAPTA